MSKSEIETQFDLLSVNIAELGKQIELLEEKISPVVSSPVEPSSEEDRAYSATTVMGQIIEKSSFDISNYTKRVRLLIENIKL